LIFWKYHGLGNDFVVVEDFDGTAPKEPDFVRSLCDRRFGVGADGILYVGRERHVDATMRVLNSDGSEAEMCGNGIRCVAKHLYDFGIVSRTKMRIGTLAGVKDIECLLADNKVKEVIVGMGSPSLECSKIPMNCEGSFIEKELQVAGRKVVGTAVSMGNPHFVTFDTLEHSEQDVLGPALESHSMFPRHTNVEFASQEGEAIGVRVLERGAGWTMACGTGACATAVAAVLTGRAKKGADVEVVLPGGSLWIKVSEDLSSVRMRGPAARIFRGETEE